MLGAGVAPRNSLRERRSLRSNRRGEYDHEARWRAPTPLLASRRPEARRRPPARGTAMRCMPAPPEIPLRTTAP